jgi:hypothetical protein
MSSKEKRQFREVFSGSPIHAGLVKSMLEDAGFRVFVKDEFLGTIAPWWSSPGGAGAVKLLVPTDELELAREVVAQYEANIKKD